MEEFIAQLMPAVISIAVTCLTAIAGYVGNAIKKYNPGKIIKESLASYFECTYAKLKNYNDIANNLIDSWNKNDENYWPYAGAKSITNNSHFADIFHESLHSFKNALSIKNK